ncbi:DNA mismatch repair protein Mlh3-like [Xenia sp. Carnegie-2017]|uniref:DNA mismatch repair protein Mlh3-like n=1 Tax=Xenia sp. Carnegie-2017 TaxID=2897299 RepID=UPI001F04B5F7|nr:DNA mismatch repair protein Mlh3-like [Xenia sp. Carnegie-2017]
MIQRLASDIISELRSDVALTSLAQCVEELVLNSIDANANSITVDLSLSKIYVEISDNGHGLLREDLDRIAQRYFTSKCHDVNDLSNSLSYGYRGEALASLVEISEQVEITSRRRESNRTYCKLFKKGRSIGIHESPTIRSRHGTTIKASDIFYTRPVRQKRISGKVELEHIRRHILAIALISPRVSFHLRNRESDTTILQTGASASAISVIAQVLGPEIATSFQPIHHTLGKFTVTGFVSMKGFPNRNFQFVYLNRRLLLKTRLHKVAKHMLSRLHESSARLDSASETCGRYAGFVIDLKCPTKSYDVAFDPRKTFVEFQNWDEPITCLEASLRKFLTKEGVPAENLPLSLAQCDSEISSERRRLSLYKRSIKACDMKRSLHSSTAKRRCETAQKTSSLVVSYNSSMDSGDTRNFFTSSLHNLIDLKTLKTSPSNASSKFPRDLSVESLTDENCSRSRTHNEVTLRESILRKLKKYGEHPTAVKRSSSVLERSPEFSSTPCYLRKNEEMRKDLTEISINNEKDKRRLGYRKQPRQLCDSSEAHSPDYIDERHDSDCCHLVEPTRQNVKNLAMKGCKNVKENTEMKDICFIHSEAEGLFPVPEVASCPKRDFDKKQVEGDGEVFTTETTCKQKEASCGSEVVESFGDLNENVDMYFGSGAPTAALDTDMTENESDWMLQPSPHSGQRLYVNLRTGNTKFDSGTPSLEAERTVHPVKMVSCVTKDNKQGGNICPFREFPPHLTRDFTNGLPRNNVKSKVVVSEQSSHVAVMWDQWVNPVFERNETHVADVSFTQTSKTTLLPRGSSRPFKFTKDCFDRLKVIRQVNDRFIMCYFKGVEDCFLIAVDQHAADERVRLERFSKVSNDSEGREKLRSEMKNFIEDLVKEQIEKMLLSKGDSSVSSLPKAITKILHSKACHGAIRFGDHLSTKECVNLVALLSKCDLPFQCAHGRQVKYKQRP